MARVRGGGKKTLVSLTSEKLAQTLFAAAFKTRPIALNLFENFQTELKSALEVERMHCCGGNAERQSAEMERRALAAASWCPTSIVRRRHGASSMPAYATVGVRGAFIGPRDLSATLGKLNQFDDPVVRGPD
jgi:hypothetical protein